jgi:uncharacterized protein (TIGR00369 family)
MSRDGLLRFNNRVIMSEEHFRRLENMYRAAPISNIYPPEIVISDAACEIQIKVQPEYFHAAGAVHGSVVFKLLDDAAFFAANSLEETFFVLTTSFNIYLTRPVSSGFIRAVGKVVTQNRLQFIAESVAYDDQGREIGRGSGTFVTGKLPLAQALGYAED